MSSFLQKTTQLLLVGKNGWGDRSAEDILGKPVSRALLSDLEKLSMKETLQLFHALEAPGLEEMNGEYSATVLKKGPFYPLADWFTHHQFGPGRWEGKAFAASSGEKSRGYNLFSEKDAAGILTTRRTREMDTRVKVSPMDARPSFCLDYSPYNHFLVGTMRDEIRKINGELYLGFGYMYAGGGPGNPAPFALFGKPRALEGADA